MQFRDQLKQALALDHPYPVRLFTPNAKAAVLVLWALDRELRPHLLLTKRTDTVATHRGQVAFPGGAVEVGDLDFTQTALRESFEEVGVESEPVEILGWMPPFVTTSYFEVTPVIGFHSTPVHQIELKQNDHEIAAVFWAALSTLADSANQKTIDFTTASGVKVKTPGYQVGDHLVWGATAYLVQNFLQRLELVSKKTE